MNWLLRIIAVEIKMHVHQNLLMTLTKLVLLFIGTTEKKNKYATFQSLYLLVKYELIICNILKCSWIRITSIPIIQQFI